MAPDASCYACGATVTASMEACRSCGVLLTEDAREAHRLQEAGEERAERWRSILVTAVLLALGVGLAAGLWLESLRSSSGTSARPAAAEATAVDTRAISPEMMHDVFLRLLNEKLHLNLASWRTSPRRGLVLRIRDPRTSRERSVWTALSVEERRQMMGFVGALYTRFLLESGRAVNLASDGHPHVTIQYEGIDQPLAERTSDGRVRVFPSPFERQRSERDPSGG